MSGLWDYPEVPPEFEAKASGSGKRKNPSQIQNDEIVLIDDDYDSEDDQFSLLAPAKKARGNTDQEFSFLESPCDPDIEKEKVSLGIGQRSDRTALSMDALKLLKNSDSIRKALDDAENLKVLNENDDLLSTSLPSASGLRMYNNSFRKPPMTNQRPTPNTQSEEDEEIMRLLKEDAQLAGATGGGEHVAEENAACVQEDKITITCQCKFGKVLIKLRVSDPLSKLQATFLASAVSKGWLPQPETPPGFRIEFDGDKVGMDETPKSLGLEDEDSVDISWKV
ncbi:hypothetical protein CEUSTIGMA_g8473.t1 [Chlamydomonas eustigma]|uniref:Rad60/SUMO-like domain-containing protein n=1 Tax=Chlamydomonas eustigma TaxID=1157962 RepID=A0A250XD77_9CHLO|nr:hypothetical protein CEUSTIGMA_g8473.t1 [Chlamydomonas eustigma]|eukprot:GAX81038.1 hypothetical protein CEUSTIGMA_g8473.t1 [Chlamydomonas eustigma]